MRTASSSTSPKAGDANPGLVIEDDGRTARLSARRRRPRAAACRRPKRTRRGRHPRGMPGPPNSSAGDVKDQDLPISGYGRNGCGRKGSAREAVMAVGRSGTSGSNDDPRSCSGPGR